jgi:hypothetical protein
VLKLTSLRSHRDAERLIKAARSLEPGEQLVIEASQLQAIFPNGGVPFAATLQALQRGMPGQFVVEGAGKECIRTGVFTPYRVPDFERHVTPLTHSVWEYTSEDEAATLAHLFVEALVDNVPCEEGVVDAINWCLYEVMDNVFQHSRASSGFVMMQLHYDRRKCVVAVSDTGVGIQKSLYLGRGGLDLDLTRIQDPIAAIGYALEQGVTSKGRQNQGNGLFGLRRAVEINGGQLKLISGRGEWSLMDGQERGKVDYDRPLLDAADHQGLTVDWRLSTAKPVRIENALGARARSSDLLEQIEDDLGQHHIDVLEIEQSLGSRQLGRDFRTRLTNYLHAGAEYLILDFQGIGVVSSSFADEVLGKLAVELGEREFRRRIILESASVTNRGLIDKAVELRLKTGL